MPVEPDGVLEFAVAQDSLTLDGRPWSSPGSLFAVVGDPISHSLSPAIHNKALSARGLPGVYVAIRIPAGGLGRLLSIGPQIGLNGFNVTSPLKHEAAGLCAESTAVAAAVGAVNTVRITDAGWVGHNTDVGGVRRVLEAAWPKAEAPELAVVLGTGGAARAATKALVDWRGPRVEVRGRSAAGREDFAAWSVGLSQSVEIKPWREGPPADPSGATVYVSCVAGGVPIRDQLPENSVPEGSLLLDLRYGPELPPLAPPLGFTCLDGVEVLVAQAGLAFEWWFERPAPWRLMAAAAALD